MVRYQMTWSQVRELLDTPQAVNDYAVHIRAIARQRKEQLES